MSDNNVVSKINEEEEQYPSLTLDIEEMERLYKMTQLDYEKYVDELENGHVFSRTNSADGFLGFIDNGASHLCVFHIDTVIMNHKQGETHFKLVTYAPNEAGNKREAVVIESPVHDDRIGAFFALSVAPSMDMNFDILICDNEECGRTTAGIAHTHLEKLGKKYRWGIELDRRKSDVVFYKYESDTAWVNAWKSVGAKVSSGSYSDISSLKIGVSCINVGTGYEEAHALSSYCVMNTFVSQCLLVKRFYDKYYDMTFSFTEPVYDYSKKHKGSSTYSNGSTYPTIISHYSADYQIRSVQARLAVEAPCITEVEQTTSYYNNYVRKCVCCGQDIEPIVNENAVKVDTYYKLHMVYEDVSEGTNGIKTTSHRNFLVTSCAACQSMYNNPPFVKGDAPLPIKITSSIYVKPLSQTTPLIPPPAESDYIIAGDALFVVKGTPRSSVSVHALKYDMCEVSKVVFNKLIGMFRESRNDFAYIDDISGKPEVTKTDFVIFAHGEKIATFKNYVEYMLSEKADLNGKTLVHAFGYDILAGVCSLCAKVHPANDLCIIDTIHGFHLIGYGDCGSTKYIAGLTNAFSLNLEFIVYNVEECLEGLELKRLAIDFKCSKCNHICKAGEYHYSHIVQDKATGRFVPTYYCEACALKIHTDAVEKFINDNRKIADEF